MIEIQLTNSQGTLTLPVLSPPLTTSPIEGAVDVTTLDNNVSTYFTQNKRLWTQPWSYLSEDDFNAIKSFYDRQWIDFEYPLLTIAHFGISNVPVRMTLSPQNTIDNCGRVEGVEATFRETTQIGS